MLRRFPIPACGLVLLDAVVDARDLAEPHGIAVSVRDDQRAVRLGLEQLAVGKDREAPLLPVDGSRRQIDVRALNGGHDLIHADPVSRQFARVHVDAHGVLCAAERLDLRHAGHRGDPLRDRRFGVLVHRRERQRGRSQVEKQDGRVAGIDFLIGRRRNLRRQLARGPRDHRLDVLGGGIDIPAQVELQGDVRVALRAGRVHRAEAGDRRKLLFERQCDGGRDGFGTGASQGRLNRNRREVDRRQIAHRQQPIGHHAEDDDPQHDEGRGDRPLDEHRREIHDATSGAAASLTLIRLPGTRRSWPSVTTVSPGFDALFDHGLGPCGPHDTHGPHLHRSIPCDNEDILALWARLNGEGWHHDRPGRRSPAVTTTFTN